MHWIDDAHLWHVNSRSKGLPRRIEKLTKRKGAFQNYVRYRDRTVQINKNQHSISEKIVANMSKVVTKMVIRPTLGVSKKQDLIKTAYYFYVLLIRHCWVVRSA